MPLIPSPDSVSLSEVEIETVEQYLNTGFNLVLLKSGDRYLVGGKINTKNCDTYLMGKGFHLYNEEFPLSDDMEGRYSNMLANGIRRWSQYARQLSGDVVKVSVSTGAVKSGRRNVNILIPTGKKYYDIEYADTTASGTRMGVVNPGIETPPEQEVIDPEGRLYRAGPRQTGSKSDPRGRVPYFAVLKNIISELEGAKSWVFNFGYSGTRVSNPPEYEDRQWYLLSVKTGEDQWLSYKQLSSMCEDYNIPGPSLLVV